MIGRWLLDTYKGRVIVFLEGRHVAELTNLAVQSGIQIWDIERKSDGRLVFNIWRSDIKRLIPLLRQTQTKVHFGKRVGIPFVWSRLRHRKMFLVGAFIFFSFLYTLTSFVWHVDVTGTDKLSLETILTAAESIGIKEGAYIGRLPDTDILQDQLLDKVPELAWAGVRIQGTHVTIQVVEKVPNIAHTPDKPQNIIASKKGNIETIYAYRGITRVKKGELVNPGDVLISGDLGNGKVVSANGVAEAQVWYTSDIEVPLTTTRKLYTGEKVTKDYLAIGNYKIQIWGYGQILWKDSTTNQDEYALTVANTTFPIRFVKEYIHEVVDQPVNFTEQEAITKGLELAVSDIGTKTGSKGRIVSQKILQTKFEHGKLYLRVLNIVVEDIGKPSPFIPEQAPSSPTKQIP